MFPKDEEEDKEVAINILHLQLLFLEGYLTTFILIRVEGRFIDGP